MSRSALIVAMDTYEDPKLRALRAPAADARALASVLRDPDIGGFDVMFAFNPKEGELRRTLSAFFADRTPDDLLLVHVGCHGVKDDDGRLYFATADTELAHLDATAVPADFVNRRMNDSRSRRIVLFLDCCYSGAFARGMAARAGDKVEIRERFEGSGRVVLTASDAMEYSFEGDDRRGQGQRSVFTSALVDGLQTGEADLDQDHLISVDELYDYVHSRVREQTPNQTPGKWSFVTGELYVARSSYVSPVAARELPADVVAMESSQLPYVRVELVERLAVLRVQPEFSERARAALERLSEDDSRQVAAAAARVLEAQADTAPSAPPKPLPALQRVAAEEAAGPRQSAVRRGSNAPLEKPAATVVAAIAASAVAGAIVGEVHWALLTHAASGNHQLPDVVASGLSGGLSVLVLSWVLVAAGRSEWPLWRAVVPTSAAAVAVSAPIGLINGATRAAFVLVYVLSGLVAGAASLVATTSARLITAGAALGGVASLLFSLLAPMTLTAANFILGYYVLAFALIGGAIAIAIVRSPVRSGS
ncbi:MAG: hypothetical protein QOK21_1783 [Solirubrobacteraceae bacterium]|nr:hypothetical protein [Solirubrobacteraceae bacterium]